MERTIIEFVNVIRLINAICIDKAKHILRSIIHFYYSVIDYISNNKKVMCDTTFIKNKAYR